MKTNKIVTFQILWVDDEIESEKLKDMYEFYFPEEVYDEKSGISYSLKVTTASNWEDAKVLLEEDKYLKDDDPERFIAIILDALCKCKRDSVPDIGVFLMNVLPGVKEYKIPYFIFSGAGPGSESLYLLEYEKSDPDYKWKKKHKPFYSKNIKADYDALKANIIEYGKNRKKHKLKYEYYREVFDRIETIGLDENAKKEVEDNLTALLMPIQYGGSTHKDYVQNAACVRKSVEHIFRSMNPNGMLPKGYVNSSELHRVNLNASFTHLLKYYLPGITNSITASIKSLISVFLHTMPEDGFDSYVDKTRSPFLLYSAVFWLCDFIMWYAMILKDPNKMKDKENRWREETKKLDLEGKDGTLHWDAEHKIWTISHNGVSFRVDKKNPENGAEDFSKYSEGMECVFLLKSGGNYKYAMRIDPIFDI